MHRVRSPQTCEGGKVPTCSPCHSIGSVTVTVVAMAIALSATGCGKPDPPAAVATAATAPKAGGGSKEAGASAEAVASQARGDLKCPAKHATPARADAAPVDDVLGVRPGLSYEEAMNAVQCSHALLVATPEPGRGFKLKSAQAASVRQGFSARFAEPRVVRSSKEILQEMQREATARGANAIREDLKPGQVKWYVGTMGPPGQERVLSVAREERFAADRVPTVEAVTAALLKKYGTATKDQHATATLHPLLRWAYDPLGRLVTGTSPLVHTCIGTSDPNLGAHLRPECGVVVQALLIPQRSNPELVDRIQVGVVDQGGGYRLLDATEQALGQSDQQRRAGEVAKAQKNAKPPSL